MKHSYNLSPSPFISSFNISYPRSKLSKNHHETHLLSPIFSDQDHSFKLYTRIGRSKRGSLFASVTRSINLSKLKIDPPPIRALFVFYARCKLLKRIEDRLERKSIPVPPLRRDYAFYEFTREIECPFSSHQRCRFIVSRCKTCLYCRNKRASANWPRVSTIERHWTPSFWRLCPETTLFISAINKLPYVGQREEEREWVRPLVRGALTIVIGGWLRFTKFRESHRDDNGGLGRHPFGSSDKIRGRVVLMNDASNLSWTTLELNCGGDGKKG